MAVSSSAQSSDYFADRPGQNRRPSASILGNYPSSPRTPLVGRSISGQFGSPGAFSRDQEETIVWELNPRFLSVGFAAESRPRHILRFGYGVEDGRRIGDYRSLIDGPSDSPHRTYEHDAWSADHELYKANIGDLDLNLVDDKLERAVRTLHADVLQLDLKPRRYLLCVPSLIPTAILDVALRVVFNHFTQPSAIALFSTPLLACVGSGMRNALVLEIGWEESVATAIGEYKIITERRSSRAKKMLVAESARLLPGHPNFTFAEDVTDRLVWCRPKDASDDLGEKTVQIPSPGTDPPQYTTLPFSGLAGPAEKTYFPSSTNDTFDESELPLHHLMYRALLALPLDLRAICMSRLIITGSGACIPGLKRRVLQELQQLLDSRSWDAVHNYGSATKFHEKRIRESEGGQELTHPKRPPDEASSDASGEIPKQSLVPARERPHDDISDIITRKAERLGLKERHPTVKGVVRGVDTLGAWAGASIVAQLKVKSAWMVDREEYMKHGLRDAAHGIGFL